MNWPKNQRVAPFPLRERWTRQKICDCQNGQPNHKTCPRNGWNNCLSCEKGYIIDPNGRIGSIECIPDPTDPWCFEDSVRTWLKKYRKNCILSNDGRDWCNNRSNVEFYDRFLYDCREQRWWWGWDLIICLFLQNNKKNHAIAWYIGPFLSRNKSL